MPVHVVGLGLDPDNLPEDSADIIDAAEVLAGGRPQLEFFEDHPAEKIVIQAPLGPVLDAVAAAASGERTVVVVADGDPLFYGIGAALIDRLGPEDVRFYPNVTVLQAAAAKLKIPWHEVETVSLHGRSDYRPLFRALTRSRWTAVLTDQANVPSRIAQAVLDKAGEAFVAWVLEDIETQSERLRKLTLAQTAETSFARRNIVLFERVTAPEVALTLGIPDSCLASDGTLTKGPVRAAGVAALRISPGDVVWDLGSGCGAMAVEASALLPAQVVAVDRNPARVALIRENIRRTGALLVDVVHGTMPACLADLPDPDRVFLGGGIGPGGEALAEACQRLRPGGRIVVHAVLLATLARVRQVLESLGWPIFVTLLSAAEAEPLGHDLHLKGLNPVFILGADKPR